MGVRFFQNHMKWLAAVLPTNRVYTEYESQKPPASHGNSLRN